MNKVLLCCVWLLAFLAGPAMAQVVPNDNPTPAAREYGYRLSAQPDSFYFDFTNGVLLAHSDERARKLAGWFHEPWESFSPSQKERFIKMVKAQSRKGLSSRPYFEELAALFVGAKVFLHVDNKKLEQFLSVTEKVLAAYPEDYGRHINYFRSVALFGFRYALHERPNNGYYCEVVSNDFDLSFVGSAEPTSTSTPAEEIDWSKVNAESARALDQQQADPFATEAVLGNPIPPKPVDPPIAGPVITVRKADIKFKSKLEEAYILKTDGTYIINEQTWAGTGGRFSWGMMGEEYKEKVYADLDKYNFKPGTPYFQAHHVKLTNKQYVDEPVLGFLIYRNEDNKPVAKRQFPLFISYESKYNVKSLPTGLTIRGGFGLEGLKANTGSFSQGISYYSLKKGSELIAKGFSPRFDLSDSLVTAKEAKATLYFGQDSLVRPGFRFTYLVGQQRLLLYRENGLYGNFPMSDSYHDLNIKADVIEVPLDSNAIIVNTNRGKGEVPAIFESRDYYSKDLQRFIESEYKFDPVLLVAGYSTRNNRTVFYAADLWPDYLKTQRMYDDLCVNLCSNGFIEWNPLSKQIRVLPMALHFAESAWKRKDYDYMGMYSYVPKGVNAILHKGTNDLDIYGLEKFYLSDSLNVFIKPKDEHITLNKGRDFSFDGKINAGAFLTSGKKFKFSYSEFKVDLTEIDSIAIDTDKEQNLEEGKGGVKLEGKRHTNDGDTTKIPTSGVLYINKPDNKSGKKQLKQYPIIDVVQFSYVYFDKPEVLNRAYNQNIYFKVPPFKMDSASSGDLSQISFKGTFSSDKIFPDFEETLRIQPDKSLGFTHKTPPQGYKLYNGQGTFYGDITLDNRGIRGKGEIHYLSSVIKSDDIVFYQDSVVAISKSLVMQRTTNPQVPFPDVKAQDFKMHWQPKQDSLVLISSRAGGPFKMYDSTTTLQGRLVVTSQGALGRGVVRRQGSTVISKNYAFKDNSFGGRNAIFRIETADPNKPAVLFENTQFNYDLAGKQAVFNREQEGVSRNTFPYVNYITSIPKATWDFDKKIISMVKPDSIDLNESYFLSSAKELEGLKFSATAAVYDIAAEALNVSGVPNIKVADALILPDSGKVSIREGGAMQQLTNARLQMDTTNLYHNLRAGVITINSRKRFEGSAIYQYVNADGDSLDIPFDHFDMPDVAAANTKRKVKATMSGGEVFEEKPLQIVPGVLFKGKVTMIADKPNLAFDGGISMNLKTSGASAWIAYKSDGDSKDFKVDLANAKDASGQKIATGIYIDATSGRLYSNFMMAPRAPGDKPLFQPGNKLSINPQTREYRVGDTEKMEGKSLAGSVYTYNDSTGVTSFEGKFNFFNDDKNVRIAAAGSGSGKSAEETSDFSFGTLMKIELPLPPPAMADMEKQIAERVKDLSLPDANDDQTALLQRVADMAGTAKAADAYNEKAKTARPALYDVTPTLGKGLVLSDVNLKWSDKEGAFYSVGEVGLANINKTNINAKVKAFIEIKKTMSGDVLTMAFQITPGTWYYISYDDQKRFATLGSTAAYNTPIMAKKGVHTPGTFAIVPADQQEKVDFLTRFHRSYLNKDYVDKDEPAEMPAAPAAAPPAGSDEPAGVGEQPEKEKEKKPEQPAASDDPFGDLGGAKPAEKDKKKEEPAANDPLGNPPAAPKTNDGAQEPTGVGTPAEEPAAAPTKKEKKKKGKKEEPKPEEQKPEEPPVDPLNDLGAPAQEPAKQPEQKPAEQKPAEQPAQTPAQEPAGVGTPAEEPAAAPAKEKKKGKGKGKEEEKKAEEPPVDPLNDLGAPVQEQPKQPEQKPAEQPPAQTPPAEQPPVQTPPPAEQKPVETPAQTPPAEKPAETPPAEQKPAETPAQPPAEQKPAEQPAPTPPAQTPPAQEPPKDNDGF